MTIGTQAALLAGFGFAAIIEIDINDIGNTGEHSSHVRTAVQVMWFLTTVGAMVLEIFALVKSMQLSILGPGLALRGPEGSMTRALVVMRVEYRRVHSLFYSGLCAFLTSVALYSWAMFQHVAKGALAGLVCALIFVASCFLVYDYRKLYMQLRLPRSHRGADTLGMAWDSDSAPATASNAALLRSHESNAVSTTTVFINRLGARHPPGTSGPRHSGSTGTEVAASQPSRLRRAFTMPSLASFGSLRAGAAQIVRTAPSARAAHTKLNTPLGLGLTSAAPAAEACSGTPPASEAQHRAITQGSMITCGSALCGDSAVVTVREKIRRHSFPDPAAISRSHPAGPTGLIFSRRPPPSQSSPPPGERAQLSRLRQPLDGYQSVSGLIFARPPSAISTSPPRSLLPPSSPTTGHRCMSSLTSLSAPNTPPLALRRASAPGSPLLPLPHVDCAALPASQSAATRDIHPRPLVSSLLQHQPSRPRRNSSPDPLNRARRLDVGSWTAEELRGHFRAKTRRTSLPNISMESGVDCYTSRRPPLSGVQLVGALSAYERHTPIMAHSATARAAQAGVAPPSTSLLPSSQLRQSPMTDDGLLSFEGILKLWRTVWGTADETAIAKTTGVPNALPAAAPIGMPLPTPPAHDSVTVHCREVGGASRSVSWTMSMNATLLEAKQAAARRFAVRAEGLDLRLESNDDNAGTTLPLTDVQMGSLLGALAIRGAVGLQIVQHSVE